MEINEFRAIAETYRRFQINVNNLKDAGTQKEIVNIVRRIIEDRDYLIKARGRYNKKVDIAQMVKNWDAAKLIANKVGFSLEELAVLAGLQEGVV